MKRVLIGGFVSFIGSIWTLAIVLYTVNHLCAEWSTPPGRFLTTVSELHLTVFFVLSVALVVWGLALLLIESFRRE